MSKQAALDAMLQASEHAQAKNRRYFSVRGRMVSIWLVSSSSRSRVTA